MPENGLGNGLPVTIWGYTADNILWELMWKSESRGLSFRHSFVSECTWSSYENRGLPSRPKLLQKYFSKIVVLAQFILKKIAKQSLYKTNSFACSLANRDKPVAATLQRECSGGMSFVMLTKIITKIVVPRNYLVIPSGTKLLLAKIFSKILIFGKLRISRVIPWKCLYILDILRAQNPSKITKKNSHGVIFVIISCQRQLNYFGQDGTRSHEVLRRAVFI